MRRSDVAAVLWVVLVAATHGGAQLSEELHKLAADFIPGSRDAPYAIKWMYEDEMEAWERAHSGAQGDEVRMTLYDGTPFMCRLPKEIVPDFTTAETKTSEVLLDEARELVEEAMNDKCIYKSSGWWTYEFCYGGHLRQFHEENGKVASEYFLGYTPELLPSEIGQLQHGFYSETYTKGTVCDLSGEHRQTEIRFSCDEGRTPTFVSISEPQSCRYVVLVKMGALCKHPNFSHKQGVVNTITCFTTRPEEEECGSEGQELPMLLRDTLF
ncbi:PRKCSH domain-containing protein [Pelomyxa schiedti]|nr:PRKCSH domain-containing protein [Pelomyxa schiedti]